jgi:hypothetical protein
MALLVFLLGTPRDEYSLFRVPTQRISTVSKSTSIEAAIWLARSRFVHEKGSFWELGAFQYGFRARFSASNGANTVVDRPPLAGHDPALKNQKTPKNSKVMNGPYRIQRPRQSQ